MARLSCRVWSTGEHGVEVRILRILLLAVLHGLLMAVLYRVLLRWWVRGWINTAANLQAGKVTSHWIHHVGTMYLWRSVISSSPHVVRLLALVTGNHHCRLPYKWIVFVNFIEVGLSFDEW